MSFSASKAVIKLHSIDAITTEMQAPLPALMKIELP
jgi:hypothetical protein